MFGIFFKSLRISSSNSSVAVSNSISHRGFSQNPLFVVSYFSSSSKFSAFIDEQKRNFTVSYLINSCGLSPERAACVYASKKLHLEIPERPDLVLNLLKNHGFTNAQISKLVNGAPWLLLSDPEKTLLPKIEFFCSVGVSSSDLSRILSSNPSLLGMSLEKHLIPCFDFLKSLLLFDEKVVTTFKRSARAFQCDITKIVAPNIALMRQLGAPQSSISCLVTKSRSAAFFKHTRFAGLVHEVMEMGLDPLKTAFVKAIEVLSSMNKPNLESKLELYKKWGWSREVSLLAFKRHPHCMAISEEKITKRMDFFVNKMGWPSIDIARNPAVLTLSLEKRIIPRCSVVQILLTKGLVKNNLSMGAFLLLTERSFLEKFVTKFQDDVPQLWNVYQGEMDHLDV